MTEGVHGSQDADSVPSPAAFYDDLAPGYHRLYGDWDAAINEQARALDLLLGHRLGEGPHRILDCAVGVGTQTLGLLQLGHRMWGTDISFGAVNGRDRNAINGGWRRNWAPPICECSRFPPTRSTR